MGLTKNYKKAVNAVVFSEKTERFRITYREVVDHEVIKITRELRGWEVLNTLDAINPIAFVSLKKICK